MLIWNLNLKKMNDHPTEWFLSIPLRMENRLGADALKLSIATVFVNNKSYTHIGSNVLFFISKNSISLILNIDLIDRFESP